MLASTRLRKDSFRAGPASPRPSPPPGVKAGAGSPLAGPTPLAQPEPPRYRVLHWSKVAEKGGTVWGQLHVPRPQLSSPQLQALERLFTSKVRVASRQAPGVLPKGHTRTLKGTIART